MCKNVKIKRNAYGVCGVHPIYWRAIDSHILFISNNLVTIQQGA